MGYKDENWIILAQKGDLRSTPLITAISLFGFHKRP